MAEYIDVEKLIKSIKETLAEFECFKSTFVYKSYEEFMKLLQEVPTADVVEVKHGEWKLHPDGSGTCSCCNRTQKSVWDYDNAQNFCGHCGADMRGENDG